MDKHRNAVNELITSLKQVRDELKVKIHLGGQEVRDEWEHLDDRFSQLKAKYEPLRHATEETADDVWESLKLLGEEIRDGFARIRKSL